MKPVLDYIKEFEFKNIFAFLLMYKMLDMLSKYPELRDLLIVLITLVVKHYYDSNTQSLAQNKTVSKALETAQAAPIVVPEGSITISNDAKV